MKTFFAYTFWMFGRGFYFVASLLDMDAVRLWNEAELSYIKKKMAEVNELRGRLK